MKIYYIFVLLILIGFLPVLSACGQTKRDSTSKGVQTSNTTFASIKQQMDKIDDSFQKDSSRFSEEARQIYHQMHSLWITMQARHAQMKQNRGGMMGGRMMRSGMMGRSGGMRAQMLSYVHRMQQMMNKSGNNSMASMFAKMGSMMNGMQPGINGSVPDSSTASLSGNKAIPAIDGKKLFFNTCSSCHGSNANGMSGVFPPLNGSPIVTGNKDVPIKIILKGLKGPLIVKKTHYNNLMPAFGATLDDAQIAGILTYLRSLPKNKAGEVTIKDVEEVRKKVINHSGHWTAKELGIQ
jgi:mono/diheme cytochrome c family protein